MKRYAALLCLVAVLVPAAVFAGANEGAAILVSTGQNAVGVPPTCANLVRTSCDQLTPITQFPVNARSFVAVYVGREPLPLFVMGCDFGIQYSSLLSIVSWNKCAELDLQTQTPLWPASGSGNSVVWTTGQTGNVICLGWFRVSTYYPTGPGLTFQAGDHPQNPARLVDGASNFDNLRVPAEGSFDGSPALGNPSCIPPTGVRNTTWGNIKNMYQN